MLSSDVGLHESEESLKVRKTGFCSVQIRFWSSTLCSCVVERNPILRSSLQDQNGSTPSEAKRGGEDPSSSRMVHAALEILSSFLDDVRSSGGAPSVVTSAASTPNRRLVGKEYSSVRPALSAARRVDVDSTAHSLQGNEPLQPRNLHEELGGLVVTVDHDSGFRVVDSTAASGTRRSPGGMSVNRSPQQSSPLTGSGLMLQHSNPMFDNHPDVFDHQDRHAAVGYGALPGIRLNTGNKLLDDKIRSAVIRSMRTFEREAQVAEKRLHQARRDHSAEIQKYIQQLDEERDARKKEAKRTAEVMATKDEAHTRELQRAEKRHREQVSLMFHLLIRRRGIVPT